MRSPLPSEELPKSEALSRHPDRELLILDIFTGLGAERRLAVFVLPTDDDPDGTPEAVYWLKV
jgi:hypothetical protein